MATNRINLVAGDTGPAIQLTLQNADGTPLDVSGTTALVVAFRAQGSTATLTRLPVTKVNTGADGLVQFTFPNGALNVSPGQYEGEVEITFANGTKQTVFDLLKFNVRANFA